MRRPVRRPSASIASTFGPTSVPSRRTSVNCTRTTPQPSTVAGQLERVGARDLVPALRRPPCRRARRSPPPPPRATARPPPARPRAARSPPCRRSRARRRGRRSAPRPRRRGSRRPPRPGCARPRITAPTASACCEAVDRRVEVHDVQALGALRLPAPRDLGRRRGRRRSRPPRGPASGAPRDPCGCRSPERRSCRPPRRVHHPHEALDHAQPDLLALLRVELHAQRRCPGRRPPRSRGRSRRWRSRPRPARRSSSCGRSRRTSPRRGRRASGAAGARAAGSSPCGARAARPRSGARARAGSRGRGEAVLLALLEQELHADADAEERLAARPPSRAAPARGRAARPRPSSRRRRRRPAAPARRPRAARPGRR